MDDALSATERHRLRRDCIAALTPWRVHAILIGRAPQHLATHVRAIVRIVTAEEASSSENDADGAIGERLASVLHRFRVGGGIQAFAAFDTECRALRQRLQDYATVSESRFLDLVDLGISSLVDIASLTPQEIAETLRMDDTAADRLSRDAKKESQDVAAVIENAIATSHGLDESQKKSLVDVIQRTFQTRQA